MGAVVGMTIAIRGGDAVVWYRHAPAAFPYIKASTQSNHGLMTPLFSCITGNPLLGHTSYTACVELEHSLIPSFAPVLMLIVPCTDISCPASLLACQSCCLQSLLTSVCTNLWCCDMCDATP